MPLPVQLIVTNKGVTRPVTVSSEVDPFVEPVPKLIATRGEAEVKVLVLLLELYPNTPPLELRSKLILICITLMVTRVPVATPGIANEDDSVKPPRLTFVRDVTFVALMFTFVPIVVDVPPTARRLALSCAICPNEPSIFVEVLLVGPAVVEVAIKDNMLLSAPSAEVTCVEVTEAALL